nr:GNAT family N-acetyltransferase [Janibacter anophelis]
MVALLADDELGASRESDDIAHYERVFDAIARDRGQYLAVVCDEHDAVVATMQLSIVPGLTRNGATRLLIEGVRVASGERSGGLGAAMFGWAHEHGRSHGAVLAQLTTDAVRTRAHAFYERLGYEASHVGFKREL